MTPQGSATPSRSQQWWDFDKGQPHDSNAGSSARAEAPPPPAGIGNRGPQARYQQATTFPSQEIEHHAPIGLPRSLGIPPAGSHFRRSRVTSPFDVDVLPSIEKESVALWTIVHDNLPCYLRSQALSTAIQGFARRVLSPEGSEAQGVTVEVKQTESGSVEEHSFADHEIMIGSHSSLPVQLVGAAVSRRHCRIVFEDGACQLVDQGSSNGTYLRGERIQSGYAYPLRTGETFAVPGHEITVRWSEDPPAPKLEAVRMTSLRIEGSSTFLGSAPRNGVLAAIRIEPAGTMVLLELDQPLCHLLVARVLGLPGGPAPSDSPKASEIAKLRPLNEVEKGVLEFLAVKLCDEVQRHWGAEAEATLHLARLYDPGDPALTEILGRGSTVVATAALDFDTRRDAVRVALSRASVEGLSRLFERRTERAGGTIGELYVRYQDLLGLVRLEFSCRVGTMQVSQSELRSLEVGAICFPDELSLRLTGDAVEGEVDLTPVLGGGGARLRGRLAEFGLAVRVEVTDIETGVGERPEIDQHEVSMSSQDQGAQAAEQVGEGAAMLEDVPMPLVIELGRLHVTVRDMAGLRPGQVLELGRSADDPVHLVIEGHIVGTGKLVNVEGEIGIQILELLR
ncbi:FliM/FliN family flagellar motor switch protein [Planctomycetota bacterium]